MPRVFTLCIVVSLASFAFAQQLEPNTPGGSATIDGQGPTGILNPTPVQANQSLALQIGGNAGSPYTMFYGSLAPTSISAAGQFIDINFFAPFGTLIDGLGINLTPSALPSTFGSLNAAGLASWAIPLNPNIIGSSFCFQGAVLDAGSALGFNITGAPQFVVIPSPISSAVLLGDDSFVLFTLLAAPASLYGTSAQTISCSTNGYFSLTTATTFGDLGEDTTKFLTGNVGGAPAGSGPVVACLWEDLDVGNAVPGQQLLIEELTSGVVRLSWENADYFPSTPFGTIRCTLDSNSQSLTFDYSGYTNGAPPMEGIVGVSDGGITGLAGAAEIDLKLGGAVLGYATGNSPESVFQNFGTGPFPEPFDLGGSILNFQDAGLGAGSWIVF